MWHNSTELGSLILMSNGLLFQNCTFHSSITSDLKAFTDKFGFDVLIVLASYLSEDQQPKRQIAVYSENLELCSQVKTPLTEHIPSHLLSEHAVEDGNGLVA